MQTYTSSIPFFTALLPFTLLNDTCSRILYLCFFYFFPYFAILILLFLSLKLLTDCSIPVVNFNHTFSVHSLCNILIHLSLFFYTSVCLATLVLNDISPILLLQTIPTFTIFTFFYFSSFVNITFYKCFFLHLYIDAI